MVQLKKIYSKIFKNNYENELKWAVGNCKSLLDVGCGSSSPIKSFSKDIFCVGVDAFQLSIDKSKKQEIHDEYYRLQVLDIDKKFNSDSFDCTLALDLIEHLDKEDGYKLLDKLEKIAKKRIIVFTPNGYLPQDEYDNNPWQVHKSGWNVEEFEKKGYKVIGINGWKPLRKEFAEIRFWPKAFWVLVSSLTQYFVRNRPKKAFQILCIKDKVN